MLETQLVSTSRPVIPIIVLEHYYISVVKIRTTYIILKPIKLVDALARSQLKHRYKSILIIRLLLTFSFNSNNITAHVIAVNRFIFILSNRWTIHTWMSRSEIRHVLINKKSSSLRIYNDNGTYCPIMVNSCWRNHEKCAQQWFLSSVPI